MESLSHPVTLIWNFFPFTLVIWNPFREILNIPFWIPRFALSPVELLWNFFPESSMILVINGTGLYYLKTIGDENRCSPENDCTKHVMKDKDLMYGIGCGMIGADLFLFSSFDQYFWGVFGGMIIIILGILTDWTFL